MEQPILDTYRVETSEQAAALLNPLRGEILAKLMEPASAAEVGRMMGEPAQRMNYHIKALEKVGLVRRTGTRQVRNLIEVLYQSIARQFVLSDTLGMGPGTLARLKDQSSLAHLVELSGRIRRDALALLEESEGQTEIPSAALQTAVCLPNLQVRSQFVREYVSLLQGLIEKYQTTTADASNTYRVVFAVYPKREGELRGTTTEENH